MTRQVKVLLADDQRLFVESLKNVLKTRTKDIDVVGIAKDGAEAVAATEKLRPDVVLLDVRMPVIDGVRACRMIRKQSPRTHIIMLTTFDDDSYVHEALGCGAVGYLLKDIPPAELIVSIRAVKEGTVMISPSIAKKLARKTHGTDEDRGRRERARAEKSLPYWISTLSKREKDILLLLAEGKENIEISGILNIAEQTVKNNVSVIYSKLGVENRIQAMRVFLENKSQIISSGT